MLKIKRENCVCNWLPLFFHLIFGELKKSIFFFVYEKDIKSELKPTKTNQFKVRLANHQKGLKID